MSPFLLVYSAVAVSIINTKKRIIKNMESNFSFPKRTKVSSMFQSNPDLSRDVLF